jgi:type II secretory pathway pseudopilin PulG
MVVVVFSMALIAPLAGNHPEIQRQQATLEALAQAKQALIAWSVTQGDVGADNFHRPGTLPCPDKNFFGGANSGNASGSCSTDGGTSIGRLPWRSLGVERLRDAYGETLWYAVSDNFRNPNLSKAAINSDAEGALLLYAADGSTLTTPTGEELAAIVLAPGPPLPGQDRAALPDAASSYLDAFNGKNNANAAGPFIMGPAKDSNGHLVTNDFVVGITARELVSALEQRALNEARNALKEYAEEHGHYPNPAPPNAANCASSVINVEASPFPQCASDSATCFGRLPEDALAPYVLPWFLQNGWGRVMIYAINDSAAACATSLNVEKKPKSYVLIAPGTARNGQSRPSLSLSNYLEDSGNADAWSANPDFFVPGINSNDQMRTEP